MGLSQAKWRTLMHLSVAPGPLTQAEIAAHLGIEEPTLVTLLHRLEGDRWVARKPASHDRRCKTVHLQPRTERVITRINATALNLRRELIRGISNRDMEVCMRVLNRVRERIDHALDRNGNGRKHR